MRGLLYAYIILSAVAILIFCNVYTVVQPALVALYYVSKTILI